MNGWVSDGICPEGETLTMKLEQAQEIHELRFVFHSDFRYPIRVTMSPNRQAQQRPGVPQELVRDYEVQLIREGKTVKTIPVKDNHQRLNVLDFEPAVCDEVRVRIMATHGSPVVTIFEMRAYG